jgi:hypothetical protein
MRVAFLPFRPSVTARTFEADPQALPPALHTYLEVVPA